MLPGRRSGDWSLLAGPADSGPARAGGGGDGERAPAQGADGIGGLMNAAGEALGGLFTFGGHGDIGAFPGEADGQSPADAAAGPGDHGHAAAQVGMKNGFGLVHTKTKVI